ncbi:endonuclease/exonuclease/phosphatase family protein [Vibrio sp. SCSIO 43136]|uniref:endonuclease/exonuclease/phosphatase family protein n=1 Tax=Vibrio sp. SCSIO 43136 TaxID=2819101 RepID=UPI00207546FF|nr:endonuclease/exonuclease/phosphatase family protein [Vibrio sp. SCSIO 43136]USD66741.1 endonuclease/exonuclease/phosphatase family protein [Vibrio sp. SCSIO 43136]
MRLTATVLICLISMNLAAQPIKVASWNIEWLSTHESKDIKQSLRSEQDFDKLADYFEKLDSEILAFQEVNDVTAIRKVVGNDYHVFFSDRIDVPSKIFDNINQFTGFAIDKSFSVTDPNDIDLLPNQRHKLRFATYVIIEREDLSEPVHLLSVHLKARCMGARKNSRDCDQLAMQSKALNLWQQERQKKGQPYVILGDFNHNLSFKGDWFYALLTEGLAKPPYLASKHTSADCLVRSNRNPKRTHQFRSVIDHILVSADLTASPSKQLVFDKTDVVNYQLSDHCPIYSTLTPSNR